MNKSDHKSDALEAIHKSAVALHRTGVIHETKLHDFDKACLVSNNELAATESQRLRDAVNR